VSGSHAKEPREEKRVPKGSHSVAAIGAAGAIIAAIIAVLPVVMDKHHGPAAPGPSTTRPGLDSPGAPVPAAAPARSPAPPKSQQATLAQGAVTIDHPPPGDSVTGCALFDGEASLAPGDTLVLSAIDVAHPDQGYFQQLVHDWDKPGMLAHWRGVQFFGAPASAGDDYEVSAVIMTLQAARTAKAAPGNSPVWHVGALPASWRVAATVRLHRKRGQPPPGCQ
jgi:hypothetical protein